MGRDEEDASPGMLEVLAGSEFAPSGSRIVGAAVLVLLVDTIDIAVWDVRVEVL